MPFYIPEQEELLRYKDSFCFEMTKEYRALLSYLTIHFFNGDENKANMVCDDIQLSCQISFSFQDIFYEFESRRVKFRDEKQISEVTELIMDLANNTRVPENNGYTPCELFELGEIPNLLQHPLDTLITTPDHRAKVDRNAPYPCGSSKKYKKCCLGKV